MEETKVPKPLPGRQAATARQARVPNSGGARVVHLSTVHVSNDVRIYLRECATLAREGFDVSLLARGVPSTAVSGVKVQSLKTYSSRLGRFIGGQAQAIWHLSRRKWDVLHFHDPELILVGFLFSLLGKRVVFDIHENVREGLWDKRWIPIKNVVIPWVLRLEAMALRRFFVVLAENSYEGLYPEVPQARRCTIRNFPDHEFFAPFRNVDRGAGLRLFYVGGVTRERGAMVTLRAIKRLSDAGHRVTFDCVGPIDTALAEDPEFSALSRQLAGDVRYHGRLPLDRAYALARTATIGLCVLQPIKNYLGSYPTKVFEYMAIGLPFVVSDFALYRQILEPFGVDAFVEPTDDQALAQVLAALGEDTTRLRQLAQAGIRAVEAAFSWAPEGRRLCHFYRQIVIPRPGQAAAS